jgi:hypothetical protein
MVVIPNRVRVVVVVSALAVCLLTLALPASPAQAQPDQMVNERLPFAYTTYHSCTNEEISIEGTQHLIFFTNEDANGGFHFKGHNNLQGTAVSVSGAKYVIQESLNNHNNYDFDVVSESASNFTMTDSFHMIRQGPATTTEDEIAVKVVFHVTVNANGEVTSVVDQYEAVCK